MTWFWRWLPLPLFFPFRWAVVHLRRGNLFRGASILLLRQVRRAWRTRLAEVLPAVVPLDRPDLAFEPVDSIIMDAVYWTGVKGYEGMVIPVWAEACRSARSVLEIGGNIGLFTVIGAKAGAAAYTVVEPVPSIIATLRRNLARNGLPHVRVVGAAAIPGSAEATVRLSIPGDSRGAPVDAFLAEMSEVTDRDRSIMIDVAGLPFRDLIQGCDVIKIDAEGMEADLLASVEDDLRVLRPTLLIEVLPESTRLGALLSRLATTAGYEIMVIPEWGSDEIVTVDAASFTSDLPMRFNSKDVMLRIPGR